MNLCDLQWLIYVLLNQYRAGIIMYYEWLAYIIPDRIKYHITFFLLIATKNYLLSKTKWLKALLIH